ncbi:MAG TPA: LPS assembly lipoprotein LptE [Gemmatimonadaceae bacterium]|nr:LPS assembly lipoprotein LptE [Gemmatimonadaceae bacterium]
MLALAALAVVVTAGACRFPYGFSGGGLPREIRTVAVLPFDNETPAPELQRELAEELRKAMSSRLGLREAAEDQASAIVRGTIVRYEIDVPVAYSANPAQATSARRRLQIVVDVEIVNQLTGKTLWSRKGISAQGEYAENAEAAGRKQAIDRIVNDVIEGAQSQW